MLEDFKNKYLSLDNQMGELVKKVNDLYDEKSSAFNSLYGTKCTVDEVCKIVDTLDVCFTVIYKGKVYTSFKKWNQNYVWSNLDHLDFIDYENIKNDVVEIRGVYEN